MPLLPPRNGSSRALKEPRLAPNLSHNCPVHRQVHQIYPLVAAHRRDFLSRFPHHQPYATSPVRFQARCSKDD